MNWNNFREKPNQSKITQIYINLYEIVQLRINLNGFAHVVQLCVNATRKYVNLHEFMQRCASLCMCFVRYVLFELEHMFVHMFM